FTAHMTMAKKFQLLLELTEDSSHENKNEIKRLISSLGKSSRNIFAHSYYVSSSDRVLFINRSSKKDIKPQFHDFTLSSFTLYVQRTLEETQSLYEALKIESSEYASFGVASLFLD